MPQLPVLHHASRVAGLVIVLATLATPASARAADTEPGEPQTSGVTGGQPPRRADPDFLFGRPRAFVGVSGGWLFASQSGGIFELARDLLTVNAGDFDAAAIRFAAGRSIGPRLDVVADVDISDTTIASEFRDFVDTDDLPIAQTTELTQTMVGGSLRFWLTPRGREVGRLAWIPNRIAPYVGAGGGARWYRFTQFGDFVEFVDLSIFTDRLESGGWTASGHVFAGASVRLTRQLFLDVEARHVWADTPLSGDFVGFDNIDLNGFQATGGIEFVF